jgi:hypothetical protein
MGKGARVRLDLPEFFQLNVFTWFCEALQWLVQSKMFW